MQEECTILVPLTQGKHAIIDCADAEKILPFRWHFAKGYAKRYRLAHEMPGSQKIRMHREILVTEPGREVDHINRDGLDNRRCNLREASRSQNITNRALLSRNTSGFRGVSWFKPHGLWRARIKVNGSEKDLGYFKDINDAARAYDDAARKYHGDFANLNFPDHD